MSSRRESMCYDFSQMGASSFASKKYLILCIIMNDLKFSQTNAGFYDFIDNAFIFDIEPYCDFGNDLGNGLPYSVCKRKL